MKNPLSGLMSKPGAFFKMILSKLGAFASVNSSFSMMRLLCFMIVFTGCLYVNAIFITNIVLVAIDKASRVMTIDWIGVVSFIGAGLGAKWGQKASETKAANTTTDTTQILTNSAG